MSNALGLGVGSTLSCDLSLIPCFFSSTTEGSLRGELSEKRPTQNGGHKCWGMGTIVVLKRTW